jgi:hypothetical protein
MSKPNGAIDRMKIALSVALLTVLTGCVGVVGDGGYYGGDVAVGGPDMYLFGGGGYDRGRDVHAYSQRGSASRGVVHPGGGGHAAGGGAHGGGGGGKR